MKEDHGLLLPQRRVLLVRATTSLLLFSLGYAFGFLHASTSNPPSTPSLSNPQILLQKPISPPTCTTSTTSPRPPPQPQQQQPPHDLFRFRTDCAPPLPQSEILPTLLQLIYNGTSPYLHFPPPHAAPLLKPRRVRGWGSTGQVFQTLIEEVRPRTIIEVGTFLGASALHMANLTRDLRSLILCLDDFRGWPGFRQLPPPPSKKRTGGGGSVFRDIGEVNGDVLLMYQFMQNVADAGEAGRVVPVPFSTGSGLAALCEWGVYGDLVEVDAGHDFHSAWADINRAWAVLRPGGVLFGHDYHTAADDRGVRRAVHLFAKVKGLRVQPNGQHWVLTPKPT